MNSNYIDVVFLYFFFCLFLLFCLFFVVQGWNNRGATSTTTYELNNPNQFMSHGAPSASRNDNAAGIRNLFVVNVDGIIVNATTNTQSVSEYILLKSGVAANVADCKSRSHPYSASDSDAIHQTTVHDYYCSSSHQATHVIKAQNEFGSTFDNVTINGFKIMRLQPAVVLIHFTLAQELKRCQRVVCLYYIFSCCLVHYRLLY